HAGGSGGGCCDVQGEPGVRYPLLKARKYSPRCGCPVRAAGGAPRQPPRFSCLGAAGEAAWRNWAPRPFRVRYSRSHGAGQSSSASHMYPRVPLRLGSPMVFAVVNGSMTTRNLKEPPLQDSPPKPKRFRLIEVPRARLAESKPAAPVKSWTVVVQRACSENGL